VREIAVTSAKGGVGKTTLALALAAGLARELPKRGRLLVVDADPQGNASMSLLDGQPPADPTLRQVLLDECEPREAIRPSRIPQIDILPADTSLADCTLLLADQIGRELRLRRALQGVESTYHTCIIDAPPGLSLISVNVLNAARDLIVPIEAAVYSAAGLARLHETVEAVKKHLCRPELTILGLCLMKLTRSKVAKDFEQQLRAHYGELVYKTTVPFHAAVEEACARNLTVGEYAPASPAAVAFAALVKELTHGQTVGTPRRNPRPHRRTARNKRRAG
jgi:chromosome partitioning protein